MPDRKDGLAFMENITVAQCLQIAYTLFYNAVELFTEEEKAILSVRPGMTDYASVRFSNEGEILRGSTPPDKDYFERIAPEKIRLQLEYVKRHYDIRVLADRLEGLV